MCDILNDFLYIAYLKIFIKHYILFEKKKDIFYISRERLRRVLRKKAAIVIHLQIYVFTLSNLQIYIVTPSHLQIYIFTLSSVVESIFKRNSIRDVLSVGSPQQNASIYIYIYIWIRFLKNRQPNFESHVERAIYWFDSEIFEMWT